MRVAALQVTHQFGDPEAALAQVDHLLAQAGPLDLALLPEACLTGYVSPAGDFDLSAQAEPLDGPTPARLADLARRHRVTLVAPHIERAGELRYNAYLVLDPRGDLVAHYRKRHPWLPETWATPGDLPYPRLSVAGRALLLAVCYDVHFLDDELGDELARADALLFPSAWVNGSARVDTRAHLLPALAARHRVAIVNANWARSRPRLPGQGGSMIVDARGALLAAAPDDGPAAVVAELRARSVRGGP